MELEFGSTPDKLKGEYLDMYAEIMSEVLHTTKFDNNSDLSTAYLGREDMTRSDKIKVEEKFPIMEQGYIVGKLLDGTECQIPLDTGASKSFMSKTQYLICKSLHSLPKFVSNTQRTQAGKGHYVSMLFIIPIIIDIHGNRFEISMFVLEIH